MLGVVYQEAFGSPDVLFVHATAYACSFVTLCLIIQLIFRYKFLLDWKISKKEMSELDTLCNTGLIWNLLIEIIACFPHPFTFLEGVKYYENDLNYSVKLTYEVNVFFVAFMFLRIYLLPRALLSSNFYTNPRA